MAKYKDFIIEHLVSAENEKVLASIPDAAHRKMIKLRKEASAQLRKLGVEINESVRGEMKEELKALCASMRHIRTLEHRDIPVVIQNLQKLTSAFQSQAVKAVNDRLPENQGADKKRVTTFPIAGQYRFSACRTNIRPAPPVGFASHAAGEIQDAIGKLEKVVQILNAGSSQTL